MRNTKHLPLPGLEAHFNGPCGRCDEPIVKGKSRIVSRRESGWIHVECASGGDDE